ncbi:MAG: DUF1566 domain-containing protein [bacterium]|nr:DUF1566 domain-containing protein [bacterium]
MKRIYLFLLLPLWVGCGGGDTLSVVSKRCLNIDVPAGYTLPDTGQRTCYDQSGDQISCPASTADAYGQDAQYSQGRDFILCGHHKVFFDNQTGLYWVRGTQSRTTYEAASTACDGLEIDQLSNWRLPNLRELSSLLDYSGTVDASSSGAPSNPFIIDNLAFSYDSSSDTTGDQTIQMMGQSWTSTARPDLTSSHYTVNFLTGNIESDNTSDSTADAFYRCVQGTEQGMVSRYTSLGDGTSQDATTDLMWQQTASNTRYSWQEALAYCEGLELGGYTDWRLPNISELQSLVDYGNATVGLDTQYFGYSHDTGTLGYYWSGTTDEETPAYAFYVCFGPCSNADSTADVMGPGAVRSGPKYDDGNLPTSIGAYQDYVQASNYVRCVRN